MHVVMVPELNPANPQKAKKPRESRFMEALVNKIGDEGTAIIIFQ